MENKKMINFVAGMTSLIVVLLICIVLLDRKETGVSRALASKTVALTLASRDTIETEGPKQSYFPVELQAEWYVKYMDYLYETGYLDPDMCPPEEQEALSAVTYGDLTGWIQAISGETLEAFEPYLAKEGSRRAGKAVGQSKFWEFYRQFLEVVNVDGAVTELETDLYGTPDNVETAAVWTAYTKDGTYRFEGLALDRYVDRRVQFLVRDREILRVDGVVSDEIVYENAWISEYSEDTVTVFIGNVRKQFPLQGVWEEDDIAGHIGDLYLKEGKPRRLVLKKDTITGTVLAVRDHEIEIKGYGRVPLAENFRIYSTYGILREQQKKDILVGYHMQKFVVANGTICAALTTERPEIDTIRVLVMTTGFQSLFHREIVLRCDAAAVLEYGDPKALKSQSVAAGETVTIDPDDPRLKDGRMVFRSEQEGGLIQVTGIERGHGAPTYPGHMEITREDEGLLLLNEVDLEEYLKRVVPSEMPPSYEKEALKAQAICARTYAWGQIQGNAYPEYGAHVDDSTNFQVYNNTDTYDTTDAAVNETFGQVAAHEGTPIQAFYYSTSCGHGTDGSVWGSDPANTPYLQAVAVQEQGRAMDLTSNEDFQAFIQSAPTDFYESSFGMFRWNVKTDSGILAEKIDDIGRITDLAVTERGPGGIAKTVLVTGTEGTRTISGQSRIRQLLGHPSLTYHRNDDSTNTGWGTLPSGFIHIENDGTDANAVTSFTIYGGGYGHGAGMSQNGAQSMAKNGTGCMEILKFFYRGCEVMDIGDVGP